MRKDLSQPKKANTYKIGRQKGLESVIKMLKTETSQLTLFDP